MTPRVHLFVAMSIDGHVATTDGGVGWLEPYADALEAFGPFVKTIGSAVMGRTTYDHALAGGYADFGMPTYVVTHRSLEPGSKASAYQGSLAELVTEIGRVHEGDIWLVGGGKLARAFHEADLVDLWTISVIPTLLGTGLPLFPPASMSERRLRLVDSKTYPSGVAELRYERTNASSA